MYARDFRALARQALSGRWGCAVLAGFIATLLGGGLISTGSNITTNISSNLQRYAENDYYGYSPLYRLFDSLPAFVISLLIVLAALVSIYVIICFILGGAVQLGYAKFNLALIDHKDAQVGDLFSQFKRFGDGFVMGLLTGIYVFLWSLLLVIPGIVAAYRYAMAPYILYENPGMRASDAIRASKELMRGNKWRLFCLHWSFFGWNLLSALTFGIGGLWLVPYMEAAQASFYRQICWERSNGATASYPGTSNQTYTQENRNRYQGPEL